MKDLKYIKKIIIMVAFSIFLHFLFLILILNLPEKEIKIVKPSIKQHYKLAIKKEKKKIVKKKKEKKDKKVDFKNKQIVDIAKPKKEKVPENPNFLSKYDSKVKKESVAKRKDNIIPKKVASKNLSVPIKIEKKRKKVVKKRKSDSKKKIEKKLIKNIKEKNTHKKEKKIVKKRDSKEAIKKENTSTTLSNPKNNKENKEKEKSKEEKIVKSDKEPNKSFKKKKISFEFSDYNFSKMLRTSNDYLKNVEEKSVTSLNTLAYVYTGYFLKLKNRLSKEWDPNRAYRTNDPYRKRYGIRDRYTVLTVTIKKDGYLKKIKVKESSGLPFLDKEAIRAFEKGQPYKIVPKGILKGNDFFTINFGFYVDNPSSTSVFYLQH